MGKENLDYILKLHKKWLENNGGKRADLSSTDLSDANLRDADLRDANLSDADLSDANLCNANQRGADLSGADLSDANPRDADLSDANLSDANLRGANLENVQSNHRTAFFALQCPEKGAYIAFKKASGYIVELEITEDALRSSATSRKCRASKARVISITSVDGTTSVERVASDYDSTFLYEVGKTVESNGFDTDRWNECSSGIHHFITREEAEQYG